MPELNAVPGSAVARLPEIADNGAVRIDGFTTVEQNFFTGGGFSNTLNHCGRRFVNGYYQCVRSKIVPDFGIILNF